MVCFALVAACMCRESVVQYVEPTQVMAPSWVRPAQHFDIWLTYYGPVSRHVDCVVDIEGDEIHVRNTMQTYSYEPMCGEPLPLGGTSHFQAEEAAAPLRIEAPTEGECSIPALAVGEYTLHIDDVEAWAANPLPITVSEVPPAGAATCDYHLSSDLWVPTNSDACGSWLEAPLQLSVRGEDGDGTWSCAGEPASCQGNNYVLPLVWRSDQVEIELIFDAAVVEDFTGAALRDSFMTMRFSYWLPTDWSAEARLVHEQLFYDVDELDALTYSDGKLGLRLRYFIDHLSLVDSRADPSCGAACACSYDLCIPSEIDIELPVAAL